MRRFSPAQVVVASLLGSPLGGTILLVYNARARRESILPPLALGLLVLAGAIGGGLLLPALRTPLALASVAAMGLVARWLTREEPEATDASWGLVAGAAFVGIVVLLAILVPSILVARPSL